MKQCSCIIIIKLDEYYLGLLSIIKVAYFCKNTGETFGLTMQSIIDIVLHGADLTLTELVCPLTADEICSWQELLSEIEKECQPEQQKQGKKIIIQEVEEEKDENTEKKTEGMIINLHVIDFPSFKHTGMNQMNTNSEHHTVFKPIHN